MIHGLKGGMKKKKTMGIYIPYSNKKAKDIDFLNICSRSKMVAVVIRLKFLWFGKIVDVRLIFFQKGVAK